MYIPVSIYDFYYLLKHSVILTTSTKNIYFILCNSWDRKIISFVTGVL